MQNVRPTRPRWQRSGTVPNRHLRARLPDAELAPRRAKALEILSSLHVVDVDAVVLDRAAQPMPTELGTLDAIHLATALLWRDATDADLIMATHDVALATAATAHGLPVVGVAPR